MTENVSAGSAAGKSAANRKWILLALRLVPALLLLTFILINTQSVQIKFLLWDVHTSLIWALTVAAVLGFAMGYFARGFKR
jgi:uncharacterized integral membrane protein